MSVVVLAGLPTALEARLRAHIKHHPDELGESHRMVWFPAAGKRAGLSLARRDGLLRMAGQENANCILIVSQKPIAESEELRNSVQPYFRCRLLGANILRGVYPTADEAVAQLREILHEEELWNELIRPSAVDHPLILPEGVFSAWPRFLDAWRAAAHAAGQIQIENTATYVQRFADAHRANKDDGTSVFRAESELLWDFQGERHGEAPFPRMWKYSFKIPPGFHYDVTHPRGRAFGLRDANQTRHDVTANAHINVDSHGWCRNP